MISNTDLRWWSPKYQRRRKGRTKILQKGYRYVRWFEDHEDAKLLWKVFERIICWGSLSRDFNAITAQLWITGSWFLEARVEAVDRRLCNQTNLSSISVVEEASLGQDRVTSRRCTLLEADSLWPTVGHIPAYQVTNDGRVRLPRPNNQFIVRIYPEIGFHGRPRFVEDHIRHRCEKDDLTSCTRDGSPVKRFL